MPVNKNAQVRYLALDRCFRNQYRYFFIEDLVEACNEALLELDFNSKGIQKRQIYNDINFMKSSAGYDAPIESYWENGHKYYRYSDANFSISQEVLTEEESRHLKESLETLSRFNGLPQFEWIEEILTRLEQEFHLKNQQNVISFDDNIYLRGRNYLSSLYNYIINNQTLLITYHPFNKDVRELIVHPLHLKQYNKRWFLLGNSAVYDTLTIIPLDRIERITISTESCSLNSEIDFDEYFDDVIGVTKKSNSNIEVFQLKVNRDYFPYIETKPIHGSQKIVKREDDFVVLQLELIPNYEFEALLLSHGENVEVIAPVYFRDVFKNRIKLLCDRYLI